MKLGVHVDKIARLRSLHCQAERSSRGFKPPPSIQLRPRLTSCQAVTRIPITYTAERRQIDVGELAQLVCRCSTFAPGQSFDSLALGAACGAEHDRDDDDTRRRPSPHLHRRLRRALHNSLECVAAYAPAQCLPKQQRHSGSGGCSRGPSPSDTGGSGIGRHARSWWELLPGQRGDRRVLVGFARAVGDAALVATVHDVVVMPELRGHGVGAALLRRLTQQLSRRGIIDVGVLAPTDSEGFFEECGFGNDTEESITMVLDRDAAAQLLSMDAAAGRGAPAPAVRVRTRGVFEWATSAAVE